MFFWCPRKHSSVNCVIFRFCVSSILYFSIFINLHFLIRFVMIVKSQFYHKCLCCWFSPVTCFKCHWQCNVKCFVFTLMSNDNDNAMLIRNTSMIRELVLCIARNPIKILSYNYMDRQKYPPGFLDYLITFYVCRRGYLIATVIWLPWKTKNSVLPWIVIN